jgi:2-iminobutanoate/2-iminopropanoate deaminase
MGSPTFLNAPDVQVTGGYSHAVIASGRLLIVSGQIGVDKEGKVVGNGDFEQQAVQAFENLKRVLAAGKAQMDDVVRLGVFIVSREYLPKFREIRARYFPGPKPVSTLVIAGLILPDLLLEIEATAQLRS